MKLEIKAGKYVVAVSGGVDSVVLLDLLFKVPEIELVVAHYDHEIRPDSNEDRKYVESLAEIYGLDFFYEEGGLGSSASEALARDKRYQFLRNVKDKVAADAIVTAHHRDDLLETAILNLLRGTGRKGLTSLQSRDDTLRPLLNFPKSEIIQYAKNHNLRWREDSTNTDTNYLRNYIRHQILPKFNESSREKLLQLINSTKTTNEQLDKLLIKQLEQGNSDKLNRRWFVGLPHDVSREVVAVWLRQNNIREFDKKAIERIVVGSKTFSPGKKIDIDKKHVIVVESDNLALKIRDR